MGIDQMQRDRKKTRNVSAGDLKFMLDRIEEVIRCAKLDTASFHKIGVDRLGNEYPTKESEVTDFIRNRVAVHHKSWIIQPLEEVAKLLLAKMIAPVE